MLEVELVLMNNVIISSFDDVLWFLDRLEESNYSVEGNWQIDEHLWHCGLAVEFSYLGYPQLNGWLIRNTVGPLVFAYFKSKKRMSHDTNKPTPGAPDLMDQDFQPIQYCRKQIESFRNWNDEMMPHEFYGKLSKRDYELAHSMHFADHFKHFQFDE